MEQFRAAAFLNQIAEIFGLEIAEKVVQLDLEFATGDFISRVGYFLSMPDNTRLPQLRHILTVGAHFTVTRMKKALVQIFLEKAGNLNEDEDHQPFLPANFESFGRINNDVTFFRKMKRVIVRDETDEDEEEDQEVEEAQEDNIQEVEQVGDQLEEAVADVGQEGEGEVMVEVELDVVVDLEVAELEMAQENQN